MRDGGWRGGENGGFAGTAPGPAVRGTVRGVGGSSPKYELIYSVLNYHTVVTLLLVRPDSY